MAVVVARIVGIVMTTFSITSVRLFIIIMIAAVAVVSCRRGGSQGESFQRRGRQ